jgi:hypothetical protein
VPIINFVDYFPVRTGQGGKFLTTDGTNISWSTIPVSGISDFPSQASHTGKFLTTNGTALSWATIEVGEITDFPSQSAHTGKFLTTNGTALNWATLSSSSLSDAALIPLENVANAFTAQQYFSEITLTDAATISWVVSTAQVAKVTITANRTMGAPNGMVNGAFYSLMVIQDGSGSKTLSWNSLFKWTSRTAPTLTTTANARDLFIFRSDGTNLYEVGRSLNVG